MPGVRKLKCLGIGHIAFLAGLFLGLCLPYTFYKFGTFIIISFPVCRMKSIEIETKLKNLPIRKYYVAQGAE